MEEEARKKEKEKGGGGEGEKKKEEEEEKEKEKEEDSGGGIVLPASSRANGKRTGNPLYFSTDGRIRSTQSGR